MEYLLDNDKYFIDDLDNRNAYVYTIRDDLELNFFSKRHKTW